MNSPANRYGFDVVNTDDDSRFVEKDYSLGGGVTMYRKDFQHGFDYEDSNDRIRGTLGTKRGEHFDKGPKKWRKPDEKDV